MLRSARAALILAAAASLTLGGCGLTTPITTQRAYAASDGVRVAVSDDVRVENLLVLTESPEGPAVLIGMLVNDSRTETVTMTLTDAEGTEIVASELAPHSFDNLNDAPVEFPDAEAVPGSTVPVTVQVPGLDATTAAVPVLDGTLEEYQQYMDELPAAEEGASPQDGASPTDEATAEATETASPEPTETATTGG